MKRIDPHRLKSGEVRTILAIKMKFSTRLLSLHEIFNFICFTETIIKCYQRPQCVYLMNTQERIFLNILCCRLFKQACRCVLLLILRLCYNLILFFNLM